MEKINRGTEMLSNNKDGPSDGDENADSSVQTVKDAFHVNTGLIPQASLEEAGSSELHELQLSVFNQDVFEQGVMDQVDQALAKEEEARLRNILQRELTAISDDILLAKKDLERANTAMANIEDLTHQNRENQRQLESIRKQKENKLKQLKLLKIRQENVRKKVVSFDRSSTSTEDAEQAGGSTFDEAFQLGNKHKKETERELMIRTGAMTPFGTVVKVSAKSVKLSGFEKVLLGRDSTQQKAQKDFGKYLKRKRSEAYKMKEKEVDDDENVNSSKVDTSKSNKLDEKGMRIHDKDFKQRRSKRNTVGLVQHKLKEDGRISDENDDNRDEANLEDDEDEYKPSREDLQDEFTDDEEYTDDLDEDEKKSETGKRKGKHRRSSLNRKRPRPLPKYRGNSEEEEPVRTKIKRDLSIRREKDDADMQSYERRLLKQQKLDSKEEAQDDGSDEDEAEAEFDGGFRVPRKLWKKLFNYQKTGVRWLWELHCQQAGGIVGDEMGLGKTIQTITFLASLRISKVRNINFPYKGLGPTIIVCPTTVMHQWLQEFHKWWPEFRVAILHSSGSFSGSESDLVRSVAKGQGILITSYNTLVIHQELVLRFNWHYVILDEGHKIRNPDAKVTLCCKQFRTPHRIILSGSPIQNNLKELWSLFDFVFPGKLGTLPDFMQHFSIPIVQGGYSNATQVQVETAYRCACVLRDTINPYLIRRMKADVKKNLNLPNKNEQVLFCRLTDVQREVYQEYLNSRECNAILQGKFQVFAGLITLRKICNHPDLSTGGPQFFQEQDMPDDLEYQFGYYKRSGKMIVVEALLKLWHKQKHRVLLFTQSKAMLNILEKLVQTEGYTYLVMDGGTAISARQPLISQYNNDASIFLFLLTTRVGGLGVNLTGADRVIIYDPDWNPSTDVQARERAWRIGQTRQVTIYRLLTAGSIEEKIYHRQIFKQFLTNRILKDPKQRRLFKSQDMFELFTLGSKDNEEGTETSALFAGTGSDVNVPRKLRKNRFDELEEKKQKEKEQKEKEDKEAFEKTEDAEKANEYQSLEEEEISLDLDKEELERMKELARQLSRKMEMEKKQHEVKDREKVEAEKMEKEQNEIKDGEKEEAGKTFDGQTLTNKEDREIDDSMCQDNLSNKTVDVEQPSSEKIHGLKNQSDKLLQSDTFSENDHSKGHNWKQNGKLWTIPTIKKTKNSDDQKRQGCDATKEIKHEMDISSPSTSKHRLLNERNKKSAVEKDLERELRRDKKRRKHRDAKFEGERIPHLVKHQTTSKPVVPEDKSQQNQKMEAGNEKHDDYVLRQLFKKTGIQGAMKHDKIMDAGRPDYAIVEAEAERVAREAATALKRSRQQCASAMSGVPTWTGQHGGLLKPRFGQKKNSLLVEKSSSKSEAPVLPASSSRATLKEREDKLFDGSISGNVSLSTKNNSMTSSDLLNRIRARKRLSALATDQDDEDDQFLRPDVILTVEPKDQELLQDIRNYISFMATRDGEATSEEIVLNFGKRLPKSDAPKFKAMLNQICDLQGGVWRLKHEFR